MFVYLLYTYTPTFGATLRKITYNYMYTTQLLHCKLGKRTILLYLLIYNDIKDKMRISHTTRQ